jgi:hypothetical protein
MLIISPTFIVLLVHDCKNNFFLTPVLKTFEGHITLEPILFHEYFDLPFVKADNHDVCAIIVDVLNIL